MGTTHLYRRWTCRRGLRTLDIARGSQSSSRSAVGDAGECSGPAEAPHPVQVIVHRGKRVVRRQTGLGPHRLKFALPAGRYRVSPDQSAAVLVKVSLSAHASAHASVLSVACD
jgi:hypothetical protein